MEKNLPANTTKASIAKTDPIIAGKTIFRINLLLPYPLSDNQIEDWLDNIKRLEPNISVQTLNLIIDRFLTGHYKWNSHEALQNIFAAISSYKAELKLIEDGLLNQARIDAEESGLPIEECIAIRHQLKNKPNDTN
jgi:hypothetical protein